MKLLKQYSMYLIRWQLSTPILAVVLILLNKCNTIVATIIANLIGGLIFFWVDKLIFKKNPELPLWEIKDNCECADCHEVGKGYRIVQWGKYDKSGDKKPKYRCQKCSAQKMETIQTYK